MNVLMRVCAHTVARDRRYARYAGLISTPKQLVWYTALPWYAIRSYTEAGQCCFDYYFDHRQVYSSLSLWAWCTRHYASCMGFHYKEGWWLNTVQNMRVWKTVLNLWNLLPWARSRPWSWPWKFLGKGNYCSAYTESRIRNTRSAVRSLKNVIWYAGGAYFCVSSIPGIV